MDLNFNDIGEIITFDTFLQGLFFMVCLALGCAIFFTDSFKRKESHPELKSKSKPFVQTPLDKFNTDLNKPESKSPLTNLNLDIKNLFPAALNLFLGMFITQIRSKDKGAVSKFSISAIMFLTIIFMSLTSGIFVKSVAEVWMEKTDRYHLGNMMWWHPETLENLHASAFDQIYEFNNNDSFNTITKNDKRQFYYFASHEVLSNELYKGRLKNSRIKSDYTQTFAMSFFILFAFAWLNLVSLQFRYFIFEMDRAERNWALKHKEKDKNNKSMWYMRLSILRSFGTAFGRNPFYAILLILIFYSLFYYLFFFNALSSNSFLNSLAAYSMALSPLVIWIISYMRYRLFTKVNRIEDKIAEQVYKKEEYLGLDFSHRKVFTKNYFTIIFLYIGLIGYLFSSVAWKKCESDKVYRAFGYYKNINEELSESFKKTIIPNIIEVSE
ncbi:MAG: hypothetical protein GQ574_00455 [Crocinitomix sp.]|nr:hypothetical protein [Crocinitomix sp.]